MTAAGGGPHEDTAEDFFEHAPCGYLSTLPDGTIVKVNRTFEQWTGHDRDGLLAGRRFQDLLSPGGRIYHETHYAPLLRMQGSVREIAVEIVRADGSRLPALINSVLMADEEGRPRLIRTTVFDATDRRRYEQQLLDGQRREHDIAQQLARSMLSGELPASPGLDVEVRLPSGRSRARGRRRLVRRVLARRRRHRRARRRRRRRPRHRGGRHDGPAAQLTVSTGLLRYACAGHPPPLVVRPGDDPCFAGDGRSLPLDADIGLTRPRPKAQRTLTPGSTVLLYTDGLIERRSHSLDEGLDRLLRQVAGHRDNAPAGLAGAVVTALRDTEHADDVCLLVARLGPAQPL